MVKLPKTILLRLLKLLSRKEKRSVKRGATIYPHFPN